MKKAFTMIELVFVIVVLGILAGVALPRLMAPADDAYDVKLKSDVASIRNAIALVRGKNLLQGKEKTTNSYPPFLDDANTSASENLFDGNSSLGTLLTYPIRSSSDQGSWMKTGTYTYAAKRGNGNSVTFTYTPTNGQFTCGTGTDCLAITE